jgi:hypothetical protein
LATANPICLRFQRTTEAFAALLASRTAETSPAVGTARMLATTIAGISLRNRRREHEEAMVSSLSVGLPYAMEAAY